MGKHQGNSNSRVSGSRVASSKYVPARPYRGNRVGTIPKNRAATKGGSHAGEYQSPPNGPGPGRAPFHWSEPPPLDATDFDGDGWVQCDPTSHLAEIRFVYGLDSVRAEATGFLPPYDPVRYIRDQDMSVLQVKFRDGNWACYWTKPGGIYTAERLETIFLQMEADTSPGQILWLSLVGIGASVKWPYATSASL